MPPEKPVFIHETACIDQPCQIGPGSRIWHFTHVMSGASIGAGCGLGQNVYIDSDVRIGDGCKIQNNVSIYKGITLEDGVFCGPSMVFTNVINPRAFIERKHEFKETLVKKGATLGANCTIVCGVTIGAYALIGAGSVVTRDVQPYALIYGIPGRPQGWACRCGVILPPELSCPECALDYRLVDGQLECLAA
jgi:UDP-2-acetamido-3-amino-2,3-dideoxy-glucuronate N-acetyltransferase